MTAATQAKLLRVLQDQEFYRVGGNETVRTNARIVAATNWGLRASTTEGTFRSDLFYRLCVAVVRLPPLRERRSDIPLLAHHFLRRAAHELGRPVRTISDEAFQYLTRHSNISCGTIGRATSASCRTLFSKPCCWHRG